MSEPAAAGEPQWQRVSPVAIVFFALRGLRRLISEAISLTPLLVVVVINESLRELALNYGLALAVAALSGGALLWYLTFRYAVEPDRILLRQGVLRRRALTLDFKRVQQADVQVPWYYRPFGLAMLSLDSAGASGQTVHISGITLEAAETLREQALTQRDQAASDSSDFAEDSTAEADYVMTLPASEVVRYGLMHNTLLVILPVLAPFSEVLIRRLETVLSWLAPDWIASDALSGGQRVTAILALLLAVLLVLVLVSVVLGLMRYYGYRLERHGEHFRYRAGLTTVLTRSVRLSRVQMITLRLSWVGRLLQRHSMLINKAGDVATAQDKESFVVPVLDAERAEALCREFELPAAPPWQATHVGVLFPGVVTWLVLSSVLLMALVSLDASAMALLLPAGLVVLGSVWSLLAWRRLRLCRTPYWLGVRQGVVGRSTRWLPAARVQSVTLKQPLWQRRLGRASLEVRAAGGRLTLPWLPVELAEQWRDELLYRAARGDML